MDFDKELEADTQRQIQGIRDKLEAETSRILSGQSQERDVYKRQTSLSSSYKYFYLITHKRRPQATYFITHSMTLSFLISVIKNQFIFLDKPIFFMLYLL